MSTKSAKPAGPAVVRSRAEIRTDHPAVAWLIAGAVGAIAAVSALVSFYGLAQVASWMGLPSSLRWTPAAILDGGAFAYTLAAYRRVSMGRSTIVQWVMVVLAAVVSAGANAAHVALGQGVVDAQVVIGAALAGLAPVWSAAAAHQVGDLIAPAAPPKPARAAQQTAQAAPAPALEPAAPVATQPQQPRALRQNDAAVQGQDGAARSRRAYTPEQRQEALRLAAEGHSQRAVAEAVGASKSVVQSWLSQAVSAGQAVGA